MRHVEHLDRRLGEHREIAGAGERILAARRPPSRSRAYRGDLLLESAPASSAAAAPPAASISWNSVQAARQSLSVRSSMPPEPAAGSATLATLDSSSSSSCVLRAMRRAKRSGRPSAVVNGSTVMASAPPMPAENAAMVVRSMFTYGSRRVIMRHAVSADDERGLGREPAGLPRRAPTVFAGRGIWRW